jgi:hypothetical protein
MIIIQNDAKYVQNLVEIFNFSSVLFLGYGLRDEYVLKLIANQTSAKSLFGAGPHFLVTSQLELPSPDVHPIRYLSSKHGDQRGALDVLDFIEQMMNQLPEVSFSGQTPKELETRSAFYISDFLPPGTHNTSQTAIIGNKAGEKFGSFTVGLGWVIEEQLIPASHALHDLLIGLLCFDKTYLPLDSLGATVNSVGEIVFRELLTSDSLGFIHREEEPAILFQPDSVIGTISFVVGKSEDGSTPTSVNTLIKRHINPVVGKEAQFEELVHLIESQVCVIEFSNDSSVPGMTRSALLMPKVSAMAWVW